MYLAELISLHATIAIVNADNYEKALQNQKSLKKYSKLIEEEKTGMSTRRISIINLPRWYWMATALPVF